MEKACIDIFFELVRSGLWERSVELKNYGDTDFSVIMQLATEQSVVGLVAAGLEHVEDIKVPQDWALQFIGQTMQIEHLNKEMNQVVAELVTDMRKTGIYTLLVKGQGVAQCYERPLWRTSGDIDLYLNEGDFQKAKAYFRPLVNKFDPDNEYTRHINMHYGEWVVEIHANQNCSLSPRINRVMNEVHNDLFYRGNVRSWDNNGMQIFLPSADNDALIIFTHYLNHFYKGGVGLRQICDWCRLLWTYRDTLDLKLLERRIRQAGLLDEWRVFGAFAVEYLGMPIEAMPFLNANDDLNANLKNKADKICEFILEVGNFGHNRDMSYYDKYPYLVRKAISAWWRVKDLCRHAMIFPLDSLKFSFAIMVNGLRSAMRGE